MNCHYEFSEEEQEAAYKKTIYYYLEKCEDFEAKINLEFITDHIAFKIASLLLVLGIGIFYLMTRGIHTTVLNAKEYNLFYYNKENTYYIIIDDLKGKTDIQLYLPNRLKELNINHYQSNHKLISNQKYNKKNGIQLNPTMDDYYELESTYSNKKKETFKLYIYHESEIKK